MASALVNCWVNCPPGASPALSWLSPVWPAVTQGCFCAACWLAAAVAALACVLAAFCAALPLITPPRIAPPAAIAAPHGEILPYLSSKTEWPLSNSRSHGTINSMHTTSEEEIWRPVLGLEETHSVSNLGRIRSEPRICASSPGRTRRVPGRVLKFCLHKTRGYYTIGLGGKTRDVHCVVAEAFLGVRPSPEMECAHEDGVKTNNRVSNLRWDTCKGNNADKIRHGTHQGGERHGNHKLSEDQVLKILVDPRKQSVIAKEYQVHQSVISRLKNRRRWKYLYS